MDDKFLIGYARVSTEDQELRLQIDALLKYGVPERRIFKEKKSGKSLKGRKLALLLEHLRPGDRIVVWKLDRLGRSVKELVHIVETIEAAGADLVSLTDQIDTTSPAGRLYFHFMAALAEFERSLISERTKAGMLAKKLADPDYVPGAKPKINGVPARLAQLQLLYNEGELQLVPKFKQRGPNKGQRIGFKVKRGTATLEAVMDVLNKCAPDAKPITSTLTISRWMDDGCPGLRLRAEDKYDGA